MRSTLDQFPLPWVVQERSTCFVVHDKTSQPLAYIHFEDKSGRLSPINQLTRDEALCIARNIVKLPELLETRNAPTDTLRPAVPDAHHDEARRIATNYCRACSATCWPTCTLTHTYKLWRTGERAVENRSEEPKINMAWYVLGRAAPKNAECVAL